MQKRSTPPTDENALRVELAACYRIFALLGWTELIYNHITVRVPGPKLHFLINPFGLRYDEVTAANLVKIDLEGRIIGESEWPVNPAGFTLHSSIHRGVAGAHCVMHTHTTAGCAVAGSKAGLSPDNFYSAQLHGRVAYHDFEGITVHADEGPRVVRSIGNAQAVILQSRPAVLGCRHRPGVCLPVDAAARLRDPGRRRDTRADDAGLRGHPASGQRRRAAVRPAPRRRARRLRCTGATDRPDRSVIS